MTNVASLEWEQVVWSREVWIADYETSTGMAKLTTGYDRYLVYPHYRHHPEILQPLEHTTVRTGKRGPGATRAPIPFAKRDTDSFAGP